MRPSRVVPVVLAAAALGACAGGPRRPSVMVLPGPGKPFEQFQADDVECRRWAEQNATGSMAQRRYDVAYQQCMYARGNQLPGVGAPPARPATPAGPRPSSAAPTAPRAAGPAEYFTVDWQAAESGGVPVVRGRIHNDADVTALNLRLLVESLDGAGQVVAEKIAWLGARELAPGTTAQFEIPLAGPTPAHRVSVYAVDWLEPGRAPRR